MELSRFINEDKHIYIYGNSSTGKTTMIREFFNNDMYDVTYLSIQIILSLEDLLKYTNNSILTIFNKNKKKKIIVIDDIDILNNNEKKKINEIIKYIKKNKKTKCPFKFIFSGINEQDKKIKELIQLCNKIHLIEKNSKQLFENNTDIILNKKYNDDFFINNEKTTHCLLFHENIINCLTKKDAPFYYSFLKNFSYGDYYDRISFQKQLWIYNDITYYIKMLYNYQNYIQIDTLPFQKSSYRFTKILTKYSNEYNNNKFIIDICKRLSICKKELFYLIRDKIYNDFTILEINRLNKYFLLNTL